jgi:hypothetical protein
VRVRRSMLSEDVESCRRVEREKRSRDMSSDKEMSLAVQSVMAVGVRGGESVDGRMSRRLGRAGGGRRRTGGAGAS